MSHHDDDTSFFDRERDRLSRDITSSFENLLSSTNSLNRKLEEVLGMTKEYPTAAALWRAFYNLMRAAGDAPDDDADQFAADGAGAGGGDGDGNGAGGGADGVGAGGEGGKQGGGGGGGMPGTGGHVVGGRSTNANANAQGRQTPGGGGGAARPTSRSDRRD